MEALFASDGAALRYALLSFLEEARLTADTPLGADILCLLQAPGKLLSPTLASVRIPRGFWALLPYSIGRYCRPEAEPALLRRVAVSCELLLCALDYFDELEDDDQSAERRVLGDGRLLNTAYTLSVLSRRALSTLPLPLVTPTQREQLLSIVDEALLIAVQGQHQDLLAEKREISVVSPEECLSIATAKAGILLRLVCHLATLAVTAPAEISVGFTQIGELIGTAFQIENDIHDLEMLLTSTSESGKSDLIRAKKTLPTVFAAQQYAALQQSSSPVDKERQALQQDTFLIRQAYEDAIAASLGCAVHLRREAQTLLLRIEEQQGCPLPDTLHILLGK